MNKVVVDASVAIKWFLPEAGSETAARLLRARRLLLAPDLIWSEVANIVWKQCRRGGIHPDEAIEIVEQFLALPMEIHPANTLAAQATRLAIDTGRTAYDCMYLALAIREDCPLLTADSRLVNALSHTDFARQVRLLDAGIDGR